MEALGGEWKLELPPTEESMEAEKEMSLVKETSPENAVDHLNHCRRLRICFVLLCALNCSRY